MSDITFLRHILDAIQEIEDFTAAGREDFEARRIVQAAVVRDLEVIGEAVKRLSRDLREANADVPWSQIAGMRDVLTHAYHRVDHDAVWNVVEVHLPVLRRRVETLLSDAAS